MNGNYLNRDEKEKEFLGRGISCPFQLTPSRKLRLVSGEEDIDQSIRIILATMPGERVMRPEFGCRVYELLFAPYDVAAEGLLVHYVREALGRWEPRIEVLDVIPRSPNREGSLWVEVRYRIKTTHDERSIIYPFYLMGEEQ